MPKKVYYDESDLLFVYSAVEWFYRNGIRVPRILPACDGNRFVNYNNMFLYLPLGFREKNVIMIEQNILYIL